MDVKENGINNLHRKCHKIKMEDSIEEAVSDLKYRGKIWVAFGR